MIDLPEDRASVAPPLGLSTWMVASTRPSNAALGGGGSPYKGTMQDGET